MAAIDRFLLHGPDYRYRVLDPADIFFLEAEGDETLVRLRGRRRLRDVRSLGEVMRRLKAFGFHEIQRGVAVNLRRVYEVRRADGGGAWEVRLEPPVNRVLKVSRRRERELFVAYGDRRG